jgi:hypothetical protein
MTQKYQDFRYGGKINGNISVISEILAECGHVGFSISRFIQGKNADKDFGLSRPKIGLHFFTIWHFLYLNF